MNYKDQQLLEEQYKLVAEIAAEPVAVETTYHIVPYIDEELANRLVKRLNLGAKYFYPFTALAHAQCGSKKQAMHTIGRRGMDVIFNLAGLDFSFRPGHIEMYGVMLPGGEICYKNELFLGMYVATDEQVAQMQKNSGSANSF